jgi:hypothetical protein
MIDELAGTAAQAAWLVTAGLWSETPEGYVFIGWEKYQPTRAEVEAARHREAERKRKYRESHRDTNGTGGGQDAGHQAESEYPDPTRPDPTLKHSSTKSVARRKPETSLPADWAPNPSHVLLARERGVDGRHEEAQFRAHAQANDRRQRDWDAAFRMWLGNAKPAVGRRSKGDQIVDVLEQGRALLEAENRKALE